MPSHPDEDVTQLDRYGRGPLGHGLVSELDRLHAIEEYADPITFAVLERVGIDPGWRCLELGAGAGSVAAWLGRRAAHVVATDLDTRFLVDLGDRVQVIRHDAAEDDFPDASFDLVHTRLLLLHLPARERVLTRIARWLAPGGRAVIEDVTIVAGDTSPSPLYRTLVDAVDRCLRTTVGTDLSWARGLPGALARAGLVDLQVTGSLLVLGCGGTGERAWRLTVDQVSDALVRGQFITREDLAAALDLSDDPAFIDFPLAFLSAVARRPA
jgi:SAM-dependent methyltransferase